LNELRNKRFDQLELRFADVQISPASSARRNASAARLKRYSTTGRPGRGHVKTEDNPHPDRRRAERGELMALNSTGISNENEFYTAPFECDSGERP
jgi:hypothetical protein